MNTLGFQAGEFCRSVCRHETQGITVLAHVDYIVCTGAT